MSCPTVQTSDASNTMSWTEQRELVLHRPANGPSMTTMNANNPPQTGGYNSQNSGGYNQHGVPAGQFTAQVKHEIQIEKNEVGGMAKQRNFVAADRYQHAVNAKIVSNKASTSAIQANGVLDANNIELMIKNGLFN